jgi:hypothetical protein
MEEHQELTPGRDLKSALDGKAAKHTAALGVQRDAFQETAMTGTLPGQSPLAKTSPDPSVEDKPRPVSWQMD